MAASEDHATRHKMPERVLIVDDDTNVLDAYRRRLGRALHVDVCDDPVDALRLIEGDHEYAVIISDFLMPKLNGVQFLSKCRERSPRSVRMMLTGLSDFGTSVDAVNAGAVFRFLLKPCPPDVLGQALVDGIRQYRLEQAEGNLVRDTLREAVLLAIDAAAMADPETYADRRRLSAAVRVVAETLDPEHAAETEIAWLLAGIGRLTLPPELLARHRTGQGLTEQEAGLVDGWRRASAAIAHAIPQLETVAAMIEGDVPGARAKRLSAAQSATGSAVLTAFEAVAALKTQGVEDSDLAARLRQDAPAGVSAGVLDAIEKHLASDGQTGYATAAALEELAPGDVLAAAVHTAAGRVLAAAGTQLSYLLIQRIRNHAASVGVQEPVKVLRPGVTVELEQSADAREA